MTLDWWMAPVTTDTDPRVPESVLSGTDGGYPRV